MLLASEVSIIRATFKNQAINILNECIRVLEKDFNDPTKDKLRLSGRLKEAHKIKTLIKYL